jgi:hypothetical protein
MDNEMTVTLMYTQLLNDLVEYVWDIVIIRFI